jgi:hypothetical protein
MLPTVFLPLYLFCFFPHQNRNKKSDQVFTLGKDLSFELYQNQPFTSLDSVQAFISVKLTA